MLSVTIPTIFVLSEYTVLPAAVIAAFSNIKRAIYCIFILELKLKVVDIYPSSSIVGVAPVSVIV
jgi:hypothetical protein